jgi:putative transposase
MEVKEVGRRYRVSDEFWERIEPVLPRRKKQRRGRPRLPLRRVLEGIFYVLRTGIQWNAVPRQFGSSSSLHRYFQHFVEDGVFERLWALALEEYDELKGIEWRWQSMDGAMTQAPLAGGKNRAQSHRSGQVGHQAEPAHGRSGHPDRPRRQRRKHP